MSRALVLLAAGLAALIVAPSGTAPVSGPPTFATAVAAEFQVGEPSVLVGPGATPTVWTVSPAGGVFRSGDRGASWAAGAQDVDTSGDASLARDANGVLYLSGLLSSSQTLASTVPVEVSLDDGQTFVRRIELVPDAAGVECDRQWTAARGNGESVTSVRCGDSGVVWRTTDAGQTYTGPFTIATDMISMGPLAYSPDGNLYAAYFTSDELRVARSADGGLTWQDFLVKSELFDSRSFAVVTADDVGNVYVAFEVSGTPLGIGFPAPPSLSKVYLTHSTNDGATWSVPVQASDNRFTAIFPWVVAGAPGKVVVTYYVERFAPSSATHGAGSADLGTPVTVWDVEMALSIDGLNAFPTFQRTVIDDAVHTGSICTSGLACAGPQNAGFGNVPTPYDRRLLDFFEARIDDAGLLYVSYGHDRPATNCLSSCALGDLVLSWVDTVVARQTGGTTLR